MDALRSSRSFYYSQRVDHVVALDMIYRRMHAFTALPTKKWLNPQFLEYTEGGRFENHHDDFRCPYTLFLYLNDVPHDAGGGTRFGQLNTTV